LQKIRMCRAPGEKRGHGSGNMAAGILSHIAWVISGAVVAVPLLLAIPAGSTAATDEAGDMRRLVALALPAFLIFGDVLVWAMRRRLDLGVLRWRQFFSGWLVAGA
jgi:hypothetical protein